jgi:hypothetical protein
VLDTRGNEHDSAVVSSTEHELVEDVLNSGWFSDFRESEKRVWLEELQKNGTLPSGLACFMYL